MMNEADCPFCPGNKEKLHPDTKRESNDSAFAIFPLGSVTLEQFLVAPLDHHVSFAKLGTTQIKDTHSLAREWAIRLDSGPEESLRGIVGNFGVTAGQTVDPHLHFNFPKFYIDTIKHGNIKNALRNELVPSGSDLLTPGHFTIAASQSRYKNIAEQEIIEIFSSAGNVMTSLMQSDDSILGFNLCANELADKGPKKSKALVFNFVPRRLNDMINEEHRRGGCMSALKRQFAAHA